MPIDLADYGSGLRNAVVTEVRRIFPQVEIELPSAAHPGYSAAFFRSPDRGGLELELIVGSDWTYTLFAGTTTLAESYPMNESEIERVHRVVREIADVARTGEPPWPESGGSD